MVDVDLALVEIIVTIVGAIGVSLLYGIYARLKGWVRRFEALEKRVSILDLNMKIFVRVMGEIDPNFAKTWNRYAAVYKQPLIDDKGVPTPTWTPKDQVEFEDRMMREMRGEEK